MKDITTLLDQPLMAFCLIHLFNDGKFEYALLEEAMASPQLAKIIITNEMQHAFIAAGKGKKT